MSQAAQISTPDYSYWQNALAGNFGPVHDSDAQPGFYRRRTRRSGPFVPVAIWQEGSELVALVDGSQADPAEIWSYCCKYPVTEAAYRERVATGKWPDEASELAATLEAPPPAGHNNPPQDPADILKGQIEAASADIGKYAEIKDDEMAAQAQSLRARLNELSSDADKKRKAEKEPHLEASRAVDAKWQPLVKAAKAAADTIRSALSAHETRKAQAEAEARRKAEEEARKRAEKAAKSDKAQQQPVEPEAATAPEPAPTTSIRGGYGRAASIKTVKVATVNDYDAAYVFLKTYKEMKDLIERLAQRAVDAGYEVPGVTVTEERKVS